MTGGIDEPEEFEPAQGSLALLLDGVEHTRADWERAAAEVLRKSGRLAADDPDTLVWERLTRRTLDGLEVRPLGTAEDRVGAAEAVRPPRAGGWDVRVEVAGRDAAALNTEALAELETGASSLWLHTIDDLPQLLDGVLLDLAPVVLDVRADHVDAARRLLDHLDGGPAALGTNLGVPATAGDADLVAAARLAREHGVLGVVVDATSVHDRGGSDVQELAWALASAVRVLRVLEAAGVPIAEAAALLEFRYAATDEQFPTIAKLRAARRLWADVVAQSGAAPVAQRQHVVTSRPMLSRYDPWVNLLRGAVAAFSAGVGGADAVTVVPFDSPLGRPDAFGRRLARNTSAVLLAEAQLGRVADPAAGAYAVERLTHDTAAAAWTLFTDFDARGASAAAHLDELIAATVAERDRQVATRRRPITGLSTFPHLGERLPEREPDPDAPVVARYGAGFEALRDDPVDTPVFLATLGPVAAHTARATFASNLLASGGISVVAAGATHDVFALASAYGAQPVVCLAGDDAAYRAWGAEAAAALRAAGARHVVVTGRPPDGADFADDVCAVGVDALAFLARVREALGRVPA